jgi:hypothetical protein
VCPKKRFASDYPRDLVNALYPGWFAGLDALPVALALAVALFLARPRFPVALLRLPPRPLPCRLAAIAAAIALPRVPRSITLFAALQQTSPLARTAALPPARRLPFARPCNTLGRAHGRSRLPEAPARQGNLTPLRAQSTSGYSKSILYRMTTAPHGPASRGLRYSAGGPFLASMGGSILESAEAPCRSSKTRGLDTGC